MTPRRLLVAQETERLQGEDDQVEIPVPVGVERGRGTAILVQIDPQRSTGFHETSVGAEVEPVVLVTAEAPEEAQRFALLLLVVGVRRDGPRGVVPGLGDDPPP